MMLHIQRALIGKLFSNFAPPFVECNILLNLVTMMQTSMGNLWHSEEPMASIAFIIIISGMGYSLVSNSVEIIQVNILL